MHSSNFKFQRANRHAARGGFTLVEIAVALAIFVIGALAIIQIFPPALNVVRGSERRTTAAQMSRSRVSDFEDSQHIAPDAIYTTVGGAWNDFKSNITNAALMQTGGIADATIPRGPTDDITQTTLGNFRHVRGEKQNVKVRCDAGTTTTHRYAATAFPNTGTINVFVDETIENVRIRPDGYLDFQGARRASNGAPVADPTPPAAAPANAVPPLESLRATSTFYVTYRWMQQVGTSPNMRVLGTIDEPLSMPDNASWTASDGRVIINDTNGDSNGDVIPGAVTVRARIFLGSVTASANEAQTGVVELDSLTIPAGFAQVSLDYDVNDWRNLAWDEVATRPANTPMDNKVNVNVPMLNLDPEAAILTLFQRPPTGTETAPVLEWSSWLDSTVSSSGTDVIDDANSSAGRVTFALLDTTPADPPPPTPTRTVFRTLDNWAHQFTVAASSYTQFLAARPLTSPREGWREYYWAEAAGASTPASQPATLYFQASEAGKLVMVNYEYDDSAGNLHHVNGAIVPISSELITSLAAGFAPNTNQMAPAPLTNLSGNPLAPSALRAVTAVRGVSLAARTAWLENGRYTQVVTKGYRPLIPVL